LADHLDFREPTATVFLLDLVNTDALEGFEGIELDFEV
jgi:hypothetical protein